MTDNKDHIDLPPDSDDSDSAPEPGRERRPSRMMGMKKFIASKTAGTRAGRKVIISFLGEEGEELLKLLKEFTTKYKDKDAATNMKKAMLRMITKIKLNLEEAQIPNNAEEKTRLPVQTFLTELIRALKIAGSEEKSDNPSDDPEHSIPRIRNAFHSIRDVVHKIFASLMQDKNIQTLDSVFDFYADEALLRALLLEAQYAEDRRGFLKLITTIVEERTDDLACLKDMDKQYMNECSRPRCQNLRVCPAGDFLGSKFCVHHHRQTVYATRDNVTLAHVASPDQLTAKFFVEFLQTYQDTTPQSELESKASSIDITNWYKLHSQLLDLAKIQRQATRKQRATALYKKFLSQSGAERSERLNISADAATDIHTKLVVSDGSDVMEVLKPVAHAAEEKMATAFAAFLKSEHYQKFLRAVTLPQDLN